MFLLLFEITFKPDQFRQVNILNNSGEGLKYEWLDLKTYEKD